MDTLIRTEFAPETTYLNTSSCGLLPRRALTALTTLAERIAAGRNQGSGSFDAVEAARASFARLAHVPADRVALGSSVTAHTAIIAASLPMGSEVLVPEGDFSSVVMPFARRRDLKLRQVPLADLADAVRPDTALVSFSTVQSADGRTADLGAIRAAAAAHGARTLVDATQSAGWLPWSAADWDYTVVGGFKYLLCPRGTSFLTVTEEAQDTLVPAQAGWYAAADQEASVYGPGGELAPDARRFDVPPAFLQYHAAEQSLALLEEVGTEAVHARVTALAARLRGGLAELGHAPVPGTSPVVALPGLAHRGPELTAADVVHSARAGNLRLSLHLYNSTADVDRALDVLSA